jgi:hypothetical protein
VALSANRESNRNKKIIILQGTSLAGLVGLAALGVGKSLKDHPQTLRDQTRVHIRACEIKAAALPAIGSQDTADEQTRLLEGLKAIVALPLPRSPPHPPPYVTRQAHPPRQPSPRRSKYSTWEV